MKIRNEAAKAAVMEFITDTFNSFEFGMMNVANMVVVKMFVNNHFDKVTAVLSNDGCIDIDALEQIALPEVEKLGKFEVPALGKKYAFDANDVKRLIAKLKEKGE